MIMLNETDLLQANGGFIGAALKVAKVAKGLAKPAAIGAGGYYTGKTVESIVANVDAMDELDRATHQYNETTDLMREFNDKRATA